MPVHTVDEMLALKSLFTQKPFANFSLSNCIARKKQGERLERGTNAWGGRHAVSVAEARTRQIQHALNKLSQEKYDEVLDELRKPEFFDPEAIKTLVVGVFQKALAEPFLASLYASLCFSLARFEVQGPESQTASPDASPASLANASNTGSMSRTATPAPLSNNNNNNNTAMAMMNRQKSLFRSTIVSYAQTEFEKEMKINIDEVIAAKMKNASSATLSEEEQEKLRQEHEEELESILKKKRANIKFVGHLFLVNLLAMNVMKTIVNTIMRMKDTPMHCPSEHDLDVLCILLTTIGARIDEGDNDSRQFLDEVMIRLQTLESYQQQQQQQPQPNNNSSNNQYRYTMRVRTKVMNLLELRSKNWTERRNAVLLTTSTCATPASIRGASPLYSTPFARTATSSTAKNHEKNHHHQQHVKDTPASKMPKSGSGGSESERSSAVGSTNFDSKKHVLAFPDTPSVSNPTTASTTAAINVSTPVAATPISFKTALLSGGNKSSTMAPTASSSSSSKPTATASTSSIAAAAAKEKDHHSSHSHHGSGSKQHHQQQQHTSPGGGSLFDRVSGSGATTATTTTSSTAKGGKKQQQQPPPLPIAKKEHASPANAATTKDNAATTTTTTTNATAATTSTSAVTTSSSNQQHQAPVASSSSSSAVPPTKLLGAVIKEVFREWLCSHSISGSWQSRFAGYGKSEEELRASIVKELIYEACMTTREDAQVEAVMFCKQGLAFGHFDFYPGFQKILRKALAEGVLTDVPKFFDRLMVSMHYAAIQQIAANPSSPSSHQQQHHNQQNPVMMNNTINTSPNLDPVDSSLGVSSNPGVRTNRTGLFRQLSQLMFAVAESNPLDDDSPEANEEVADGLLRLWQAAPRDEKVDDSVVDFILRPRACSKKFPEMVVEMLTFAVHEAKVLSADPVKKWLASGESTDSPLRALLATNFDEK